MRWVLDVSVPLIAFAVALVGAAICTDIVRRILLHLGHVDRPRIDRWHRQPVPRPGGPAMVAVILVGIALFVPRPWSPHFWGTLVGSVVVFGVGLLDDVVHLSNPSKLALLILGAAVPLLFGLSFTMVPLLIAMPLSLLWILVITNAVNWLDNMDGLAAGVSAISAATLAILSWSLADPVGTTVAALVAGSCVGFLIFNFSPARIFMGDSGSGFLGFILASLALLGTARQVTNVLVAFVVPVMVLSIPIFDSVVVTLARIASGRRLLQGGRDHPSHRLVVLGLSERRAVLYLYALSALSAMAALMTTRMGAWTGMVLTGILVLLFFVLGAMLRRVRVYQDLLPSTPNGRTVLWQLMHKRRLGEMILDLVLISVAYLAAYLLRFEGTIPAEMVNAVARSLPIVLSVKMAVFYLSGLYREDWRYVGVLDLLVMIRASALASLSMVTVLFIWARLTGFSRAALVIDWILTLGLLTGTRMSVRLFVEYFASQRVVGRRALIVGAGQGGITLLQELRNNPALPYRPIGFVDDDRAKQGAVIRSVAVLGKTNDIPVLVNQHRVDEVLIAAPSMTPQDIDRIRSMCAESGVVCRIIRPVLDSE